MLIIIVLVIAAAAVLVWVILGRGEVQGQLEAERALFVPPGGYAEYIEAVPAVPDERNAAALYLKADAAYEALPQHLLSDLLDSSDPEKLAAAVAGARPAIELAHEAMDRPFFDVAWRGQGPLKFSNEQLALPFGSAARSIARLLSAEARLAAAQGDASRAVRTLTSGLTTHEHLRTYPDLTLFLVLIAAESLILDDFQQVGADADAEALRGFDAALAQHDWMTYVRQVLLLDRAHRVSEQQPFGEPREMLAWLQANREAIESLDEPYHEDPVPPPTALPQLHVTLLGVRQKMVHPRTSIRQAAVMQTTTNLLRSAIALRLHKLEHGTYPAEYTPLIDLFTGAPLEYTLTDDGFTLRSAGEMMDGSALEVRWE
jgi:hypothetical protein